ncbi:MAG: serine/threonine protein kinase [Chitinophagales bacterium]|nr:serine/threonine protein kinase [Chitinophagales bacterium]
MEVSLQSFRKRFTYDPQKDLLGKGGFGEVYRAYDNEDHHFVALKISQGTADDKYNLVNEVKRFKKLSHPNIVQHIEAYEVNTGSTDIHGKPILYLVGILEYADKGTLADLLKKGTPDYRLIEDLAKDIIEGLAYLHSNNIIHRDLKPTNILLFSEGEKLRAKITDFGIAKRADATATGTQLVGTVEYMAPEYFTTGNITPASDVWSVGVMLLEALTGTHPFGKTSQGIGNEQIIANILNKDLTTTTQNLTEPLKGIITRCLFRENNLRPQSANELTGLSKQSRDAFSEKTQVIDAKFRKSITEKPKSRWKRLGTALFDFDVRNGKWKKILARELLIAITIPILMGVVFGLICHSCDCVFDEQEAVIDPIIGVLSFLFFRGLINSIIWAYKELGFSFPTISERTSKAIKYLLLIVFLMLLFSIAFYNTYQKYYRTEEKPITDWVNVPTDTVDYKSLPDIDTLPSPKEIFGNDDTVIGSTIESEKPITKRAKEGDEKKQGLHVEKVITRYLLITCSSKDGNSRCCSWVLEMRNYSKDFVDKIPNILPYNNIEVLTFETFGQASNAYDNYMCKVNIPLIKIEEKEAKGVGTGHGTVY